MEEFQDTDKLLLDNAKKVVSDDTDHEDVFNAKRASQEEAILFMQSE